jgi:hypothetical protein
MVVDLANQALAASVSLLTCWRELDIAQAASGTVAANETDGAAVRPAPHSPLPLPPLLPTVPLGVKAIGRGKSVILPAAGSGGVSAEALPAVERWPSGGGDMIGAMRCVQCYVGGWWMPDFAGWVGEVFFIGWGGGTAIPLRSPNPVASLPFLWCACTLSGGGDMIGAMRCVHCPSFGLRAPCPRALAAVAAASERCCSNAANGSCGCGPRSRPSPAARPPRTTFARQCCHRPPLHPLLLRHRKRPRPQQRRRPPRRQRPSRKKRARAGARQRARQSRGPAAAAAARPAAAGALAGAVPLAPAVPAACCLRFVCATLSSRGFSSRWVVRVRYP